MVKTPSRISRIPRAAAAVLVAFGGAARAQVAAKSVNLAPPTGPVVGEFTGVAAIRELADGTVLVVERSPEVAVWRVSFATGKLSIAVRIGPGPREMENAGRLFALPRDSTLVAGGGLGGSRILAGPEVAITVIPGSPSRGGPTDGAVVGVDARGSVLLALPTTADGQPAPPGIADSVVLLRTRRGSDAADTLLRLGAGQKGLFTSRMQTTDGPLVFMSDNPLSVDEQAVMFLDGWIAVAHLNPYRVSWIQPDGRMLEGPPIPYDAPAVDDAEKQAAIRRRVGSLPYWPRDPNAYGGWPRRVPAFVREGLLAVPAGSLLVRRMPSARSEQQRYDVVDRSGHVVQIVTVPLDQRIVGFGRAAVYVVTKDDDDVEHLRRHPWP